MSSRLRLSTITAPWVLAAAMPLLAQASAPPAPIVLFTGTGDIQARSTIDASLRAFCAQQQCQVVRSDVPMARSGSSKAGTFWSIAPVDGGGVGISVFEWNNVLHLTAIASRVCRLAQWSLVHKIQLLAAISRSGMSVAPAHEENCIPARDDRHAALKPQATPP